MAGRPEHGSTAPSLADWCRLWQLWDAATLDMIPREDITAKPLQLRHPFIFYCGHLPAFTDARLARVLQQPLTEPAHFAHMFARGIDPDLEDPTKCHSHSPVPDHWPQLSAILQYRDDVRARIETLCKLYSNSSTASRAPEHAGASPEAAPADLLAIAAPPVDVQHVLWMCYEHEAMHLETFMYMLVQYDKVKPPPTHLLQQHIRTPTASGNWGTSQRLLQQQRQQDQLDSNKPLDMKQLVLHSGPPGCDGVLAETLPLPAAAEWVHLPGQHVTIGFDADDLNNTLASSSRPLAAEASLPAAAAGLDLAPARPHAAATAAGLCRFGWDNESPARTEFVDSCWMQHRPVCVLEYLWYLAHQVCKHSACDSLLQQQQETKFRCQGSSACWAAVGAGSTCSTWSDSGSSEGATAGVAAMLRSGGAWHHLVPLSLEVAAAANTLDAAADGSFSAAPVGAAAAEIEANNTRSHPSAAQVGERQQADTRAAEEHLNAAVTHVFHVLQQLVSVKTVFGGVSVHRSGYWPIYCSASQAHEYAAWWDASSRSSSGSRLPSELELLLAQHHNKEAFYAADGTALAATAAEHLESVDFTVWHPVDVQHEVKPANNICSTSEAMGADSSFGAAQEQQPQLGKEYMVSQLNDNGWEWSSTMLAEHPGFAPHPLYPEYSTDFFDSKHHVLLGASWATLNSIAGRKTFRNFYQAGQQHVFAKFRLCKAV